jgi:E3 ubiquitin-protein ligase RNF14
MSQSISGELRLVWASDVVLFSIIDTLQHALEDEPGLLHIGPTSDRPSATFDADLIRFNAAQSSELFASQTYACSICLEPQKGRRCIQLGCHHVFCVACLHAYFSLSIHEGIVKSVACPNCSDERAKALKERPGLEGSDLPGHVDESVLGEIVGPELLARYQWLVDKQRWEACVRFFPYAHLTEHQRDPSIAFCPRESCQAAVPADTNEAYAKLRTCPRCSFSFCVFCKRTWHGSHVPCKISHKESLVGRYLEAGEAERDLLHRQYGEATIRKLVETYLEDRANEEWKSAHTTPCPDCGVPVEKSVGCSHSKLLIGDLRGADHGHSDMRQVRSTFLFQMRTALARLRAVQAL